MKRKEFIQQLSGIGCVLPRHGARHDVYLNPLNGKKQPILRHAEIHDKLVRHILKQLGLMGK
ncbi:MAG: type II toxin-antitoxin system HicA family toxin [bacterium]|nr:type II toxin-antitoxin system HicA family toxin [bacterium]